MNKKSLSSRMKGYENIWRHYLPNKSYVIIRLDGKAFHTFTKKCEKPFDKMLNEIFERAIINLCKEVQCVKFAYHQFDEVSLVLSDMDSINSESWLANNIQKIVSVSASILTAEFNRWQLYWHSRNLATNGGRVMIHNDFMKFDFAKFDSRVFILPNENEVVNYFIWRQQDAIKNSIQMLAQSLFSHKELQNLNCNQLQDKMFNEKNVDWNNCSTIQKRGSGFYKSKIEMKHDLISDSFIRNLWICDNDIPIFSKDREYILNKI